MLGLFAAKGQKDVALALYGSAVAQARQPLFYVSFGVHDSIDGRFDLLVLHVFLILHRLGQEGKAARDLGQDLFDLMFADMDRTLREMGVSDTGVGKRIKAMAQAFYGRVGAYETALGDRAELAEALRRNLYRGAEIERATLDHMTLYVENQVAALAGLDINDLQKGRVSFTLPEVP